jgi:hypothetical protein
MLFETELEQLQRGHVHESGEARVVAFTRNSRKALGCGIDMLLIGGLVQRLTKQHQQRHFVVLTRPAAAARGRRNLVVELVDDASGDIPDNAMATYYGSFRPRSAIAVDIGGRLYLPASPARRHRWSDPSPLV